MPPVVTKQRMPSAPASNGVKVKAKAGSILAEAVPVAEVEHDWVKMVIYGQNRTGKTTLSCLFPKPLLLISFEPGLGGGSKSVRKVPGVTFIHIDSKAQAVGLARELQTDTQFKTHVLDTCTSIQDVILKEMMNLSDVPVQLNWGTVPEDFYRERSEQAKEVMREYLRLPANTIYLCQERDHNPPRDVKSGRPQPKLTRLPSDESIFASDLGQGTVKWMHDSMDYVLRLYMEKEVLVKVTKTKVPATNQVVETREEIETGKLVRRLRTMYHTNFYAGIRSENPEAVPEFIEAVTPEEMYAKLTQVIAGTYRVPKTG